MLATLHNLRSLLSGKCSSCELREKLFAESSEQQAVLKEKLELSYTEIKRLNIAADDAAKLHARQTELLQNDITARDARISILEAQQTSFERLNAGEGRLAVYFRNNYSAAIESGKHDRFLTAADAAIYYLKKGNKP